MGKNIPLKEVEDRILSAFCLGVGAPALSRAVASKGFSKRVLGAARKEGLRPKAKNKGFRLEEL